MFRYHLRYIFDHHCATTLSTNWVIRGMMPKPFSLQEHVWRPQRLPIVQHSNEAHVFVPALPAILALRQNEAVCHECVCLVFRLSRCLVVGCQSWMLRLHHFVCFHRWHCDHYPMMRYRMLLVHYYASMPSYWSVPTSANDFHSSTLLMERSNLLDPSRDLRRSPQLQLLLGSQLLLPLGLQLPPPDSILCWILYLATLCLWTLDL